jgi:hypothetical protein
VSEEGKVSEGRGQGVVEAYPRPGAASGGANPFGDRRRGRPHAAACASAGRRQGDFARSPLAFGGFSGIFKTGLKQIDFGMLQPFRDPK